MLYDPQCLIKPTWKLQVDRSLGRPEYGVSAGIDAMSGFENYVEPKMTQDHYGHQKPVIDGVMGFFPSHMGLNPSNIE